MAGDVGPVGGRIFGVPELTVTGAGPDEPFFNLRGCDRKHDFAIELPQVVADDAARWNNMRRVLAGQIRTDDRPGLTGVRASENHLATVVHGGMVERINRQWRRPVAAIFQLVRRRVEGVLPGTDGMR